MLNKEAASHTLMAAPGACNSPISGPSSEMLLSDRFSLLSPLLVGSCSA